MAVCSKCGCDLPGVETLCRDCYHDLYLAATAPPGPKRDFWQRWGHRFGRMDSLFLFLAILAASVILYWLLSLSPLWVQRSAALLASFLIWSSVLWGKLLLRPKTRGWWTVLFIAVFTTAAVCSLLVVFGGTGMWKSLAIVSVVCLGAFEFVCRRVFG